MSEQQHDRDLDPVSLENQRRMAYDRSKWLQTSTHEIAKYEYTKEELKQFFNELLDVMGRVKSKFGCSLCGTFPKKVSKSKGVCKVSKNLFLLLHSTEFCGALW